MYRAACVCLDRALSFSFSHALLSSLFPFPRTVTEHNAEAPDEDEAPSSDTLDSRVSELEKHIHF
jgi:hypothetical protein